MRRRSFLQCGTLGCLPAGSASLAADPPTETRSAPPVPEFELDSIDIAALQDGQRTGRWSAATLTALYLERIEAIDRNGPALRSVIETNPDALEIAGRLDAERKAGRLRGPLHGIPILLKDNIDTADRMQTTAGSIALEGAPARADALLAARLRQAGAVILGKTNLSEWANFRGVRSTSGWSSRGGQTRNPYVLDRNPSGSSSGSAVAAAASLCAAAVGTETDGSILSPSAYCGLVGLKPTVGLISQSGIIPISRSQDTAGPMARTVADAAVLLGALTGAATADATSAAPAALKGIRLGIVREFFEDPAAVAKVLNTAVDALREAGAELVDVAFPGRLEGLGEAEIRVLHHEFKAGLDDYLGRREGARIRSLADLIAFNEMHRDTVMPWFGQEHCLAAQECGPLTNEAYLEARRTCLRLARTEGIDALLETHRVEALVVPSGGPAHVTDWLFGDQGMPTGYSVAAVAGTPSLTIPAGHVRGLPVGIAFLGRAWSEMPLLKIGLAFEQATHHRRAPQFLATFGG